MLVLSADYVESKSNNCLPLIRIFTRIQLICRDQIVQSGPYVIVFTVETQDERVRELVFERTETTESADVNNIAEKTMQEKDK